MLTISEAFYSVQGEGVSTGVPSYFVRLKDCNLICGGRDGKWLKEGKATWYCDTENVWRNGTEWTYDKLVKQMEDDGALDQILEGTCHIIWTGGEPTFKNHPQDIMKFLDQLRVEFPQSNPYSEIETNGTIMAPDIMYNVRVNRQEDGIDFELPYINQINCSPKLSNSGLPKKLRYNPEAILQIKDHPNAWFKFVVNEEDNIREINEEWVRELDIHPSKVILMPGVSERKDLFERAEFAANMAMKYGYRMCTRLQVEIWDMTTGV
jgi:organic radical activating enzyme